MPQGSCGARRPLCMDAHLPAPLCPDSSTSTLPDSAWDRLARPLLCCCSLAQTEGCDCLCAVCSLQRLRQSRRVRLLSGQPSGTASPSPTCQRWRMMRRRGSSCAQQVRLLGTACGSILLRSAQRGAAALGSAHALASSGLQPAAERKMLGGPFRLPGHCIRWHPPRLPSAPAAVGEGEYFLALLPDGSRLVHPIAYGERFPLNFGREVLAQLAGVPQRWVAPPGLKRDGACWCRGAGARSGGWPASQQTRSAGRRAAGGDAGVPSKGSVRLWTLDWCCRARSLHFPREAKPDSHPPTPKPPPHPHALCTGPTGRLASPARRRRRRAQSGSRRPSSRTTS